MIGLNRISFSKYWPSTRLVIGIISLIVSIIIFYQSCAVGLLNTFLFDGSILEVFGIVSSIAVFIINEQEYPHL